MKPGPAQAGEQSADREVDQQLVVRRRSGSVNSHNPDERDARNGGADYRHVVSDHKAESPDEALSCNRRPVAHCCGLDPRTALEGEKRG